MKFSVFQVSRRGGRSKNEDRMGYCYTRESSLFVLADGMGGHPDGEVAAQIALQTVSAYFQKTARPTVGSVPEFLSSALMAAHHQILRYASEKGMLDSPRTTLVAAVVERGVVHWVHCGDSRLYLVRDGELVTRTRDHSFSEQHAQLHSRPSNYNRNVLFTCLGSPQRPIYDASAAVPLQQGDKLLLCSDGLWSALGDSEIVSHLAAYPVAQAVPELTERALRKAGSTSDNVTLLALEWETPDVFESTRGISTDGIGDGVFESTIERSAVDSVAEEMDDAAIERSIAEINEAIRRTSARRV
ncbi:MAG: PP2C family serine/threonine-protein phosphatase [Burkholderiaceae bacterium]